MLGRYVVIGVCGEGLLMIGSCCMFVNAQTYMQVFCSSTVGGPIILYDIALRVEGAHKAVLSCGPILI